MSNVASLRNGEWYQDLYGWSRVLDLSVSCRAAKVLLEADDAGHVDDVVVYPRDATKPVEYVQVKFHMRTEGGRYSTAALIEKPGGAKPTGKSLLKKFWDSWQLLQGGARGVRLVLVSNWSWADDDPLAPLFSSVNDGLPASYFTASSNSKVGRAREAWRAHVGADEAEFNAFIKAMEFRLGRGSIKSLTEHLADRMEDRCLRADENAVTLAVTQVGRWIRERRTEITPEIYEQALGDLELKLPDAEPAIRICLHTVERQTYDEEFDHVIDWCDRFLPLDAECIFPRGHAVVDAGVWNGDFLPELQTLKAQLNSGSIRLLRVRGQARLSAWIAFGHVFERRAGYVLELDQYGKHWRTDAAPATGMQAIASEPELFGRGRDLAFAVNIANDATPAARTTIETLEIPVDELLAFTPSSGVGTQAITSAGHLRAFIDSVRQQMSSAMSARNATRAHLFYTGPSAGAASLGHALGAAVPEVQVYEFPGPGYAASFLLRG